MNQVDETAWCACFVQWCLLEAGKPAGRGANAEAWKTYGSRSSPQDGAITVIFRPRGELPFCCARQALPVRLAIRRGLTPRHTVHRMIESRGFAMLNSVSAKACIEEFINEPSVWRRMFAMAPRECARIEITGRQAALLLWASKVMVNADWDHKPKISARFKSRGTGSGTWHVRDDYKYFYDIWSNIHYGYVGRAAGFSESLLLDGAGLEQLATDLIVRPSPPTRSTNVAGLRAYDDPSDREAIRIGVVLYRANSAAVTSTQILSEVLSNGSLTRERL